MRKLLIITGLLVATQAPLHAQTAAWNWFCQLGAQAVFTSGLKSTTLVQSSYPQCTVTVYLTGTLTLATVNSSAAGAPLSNPFQANTDGSILFFASTGNCYDIVTSVSTSGGSPSMPNPFTYTDVCLGGGGGGGGGPIGPGTVNQVAKFISPNNVGNSSGGPDDGTNPVPWVNGLSVNGSGYNKSRPNGVSCTTPQLLVEYDGSTGSGNRASVRTAIASSTNVIGVAGQGAGCSGDVQIIDHGYGPCVFDGGPTVPHDIVTASATPGECSDVGLTPTGVQRIGRVASVNAGVGTVAIVDWFTGDFSPGASGGSGNILNCAVTGCNAYYLTGGTNTIAGDTNVLDLGNGIMQMFGAHFVDTAHSGWWDVLAGPALPSITDTHAVYWGLNPGFVAASYGIEPFDSIPTVGDCVDMRAGDFTGWVKLHDSGNPCGTGGGGGGTTAANPSVPVVTPKGTTGATSYTYGIVGCQDVGCTSTSAISPIGSTSTGNATLTTSNFNQLTAYADTLYGYRGYLVCRITGGATQGIITGSHASPQLAGKIINDTGLTADGTNCATTYGTNKTTLTNVCLGSALPGFPSVPGFPCGIDGPPLAPTLFDDEMMDSFGAPGDANNPFWSWGLQNAAIASYSGGTIILHPDGTTANIDYLVNAATLPSTPYTFKVYVSVADVGNLAPHNDTCVLGLRESSTGKMANIEIMMNQIPSSTTGSGGNVVGSRDTTGSGATGLSPYIAFVGTTGAYLTIQNTGTTIVRSYSPSADGVGFAQVSSEAITTPFTTAPNQLIIGISGQNAIFQTCTFDFERRIQ